MFIVALVSVPLLVILIAEMIVTIYSYLYVFLVLGSQLFLNPGESILQSRRMIEELKTFEKKHRYAMRMLVGRARMQYQIDQEDSPDVLRNLSRDILKDPFYDACLWISWPFEWVLRTVKRQFEHYDVEN